MFKDPAGVARGSIRRDGRGVFRRAAWGAELAAVGAILLAASVLAKQHDSWIEPITGMVFVRIPAGSFEMGSPGSEAGREAHETRRTTRIDREFWLGAYEVTQAEWRVVMGTDPSHFKGGKRPVENVSLHDVDAFLRALESRSPGNHYRLPSEEEWEYACRAGSTTAYAWGEGLDTRDANVAAHIHDSITGRGETMPVGSYRPNAWGLYDMHGNVWEWTSSVAGWTLALDGSALNVIRGGSWYYERDSARCAVRYTHRPQDSGFSLGFRVVRMSDGAP